MSYDVVAVPAAGNYPGGNREVRALYKLIWLTTLSHNTVVNFFPFIHSKTSYKTEITVVYF